MGSLHCNFCGEELRLRQQPPWRYSVRTLGLFVGAGVAAIVGPVLVGLALTEFIPAGPGTSQISFVVGMGAALAAAYLGFRQPRTRTVRCSSCGVPEQVSSKPQRGGPILESVRADLALFIQDSDTDGAGSQEAEKERIAMKNRAALKTRMRKNKRLRKKAKR